MAQDPEAALSRARRQGGCGCRPPFLLALLTCSLIFVLAFAVWRWLDRNELNETASEVDRGAAASTSASPSTTGLDTSKAATAPPTHRRMLRLDRGMVLRRQPKKDAPTVFLLPEAALLRVIDQQDAWYRVDATSLGADGPSWLYLEDGPSRELRVQSVWQTPRPSRALSASRRALALEHLGSDWTAGRCGPYPLLTDVNQAAALQACHRLAESLDAVYRQRFGVTPVGTAGETLILFRQLEAFRDFVRAEGLSSVGYAGHANASGGYLALYLGEQDLDDFAVTLVHELTHLVSWRALGGPLPRWLSEGLADGIGESATAQGISQPRGMDGLEAEAQRLRSASGGFPSSLELASLDAQGFDARPQDRHYEHSSLLVRFLMLDDELAPRFRSYLGDLAAGQGVAGQGDDPESLRHRLDISWDELDQRFSRWLIELL